MRQMRIHISNLEKHHQQIERDLRHSHIAVLPSDTVYGLCCLASDVKAQRKIYRLKRRPLNKHLPVIFPSIFDILKYCHVQPCEKRFLEAHFPGQFSIILPLRRSFTPLLHTTICARVPEHKSIRQLLKATGPLVATSLNLSAQPTITSLSECPKPVLRRARWIVDEGTLGAIPTTIVCFVNNKIQTVRHGILPIPETER